MNFIHDYLEKVDGIQPEVYSPSAMFDRVKGSRVNMKAILDTAFKNLPTFSCRTLWVIGYISCFVFMWEIVHVILRMEAGCCDVFCAMLFSSHVHIFITLHFKIHHKLLSSLLYKKYCIGVQSPFRVVVCV